MAKPDDVVKQIKKATRRKFSADEKIGIVLEGLRGEIPWMREIYDKVKHGRKKRSKVAIVALARQLLVRCWAILRDESCWDRDHAKRFVKC